MTERAGEATSTAPELARESTSTAPGRIDLDGRWYRAASEPEIIEFGAVQGLAVSGQGEPGGAAYGSAAHALYAVAGAMPGASGRAFPMPPLEGQWWVEDERSPFEVPRAEWRWHLFLRLPDDLDAVQWAGPAREAAREQTPAVSRVQLVSFVEGRCVQMLHRGPYADEPRTLARMAKLMDAERLVPNGPHHEIYLSDPGASDQSAQETILRQPVRAA